MTVFLKRFYHRLHYQKADRSKKEIMPSRA